MSETVYGPETWKADSTGAWSYWDLWFCTSAPLSATWHARNIQVLERFP
jgi:hypothetical protein